MKMHWMKNLTWPTELGCQAFTNRPAVRSGSASPRSAAPPFPASEGRDPARPARGGAAPSPSTAPRRRRQLFPTSHSGTPQTAPAPSWHPPSPFQPRQLPSLPSTSRAPLPTRPRELYFKLRDHDRSCSSPAFSF